MKIVLCFTALVLCMMGAECSPTVFRFEQQAEPRKPDVGATCGYENCELGKGGMLNVHLVPHTHDDTGWLKTVDQYYYDEVQYILDNAISELRDNPARRFIYVEVAFFYRWWNEQHDSIRHIVKGLVNEGRLEFILGGWCMNDEASTHYSAIIDQHTAGFYFLERNFGSCALPKIGWQIDPFGHSREQASLFAQFGFDGLFFGRLDYQDKEKRLKDKTMEMMWLGSDNLGDQAALFTGVNYNGYGPPDGFCYDQGCSDPSIMDDDRLEDYNVEDRVKAFIKAAHDQSGNFSTKHIMMTMGSDFQYQNAHKNFKNLDKLIKYVNEEQAKGSDVNAFYSTPSCYLYALNRVNETYTSKSDDFFPYASDAHQVWTGYFTSRPSFKGYVRDVNNFFQNVRQLDTISQLEVEHGSSFKIDILRRALGVAQHHDSVSGTEKQVVTYDYTKRMAIGVENCKEVVNSAYSKLLPLTNATAPDQHFCDLLNVSYCAATEDNKKFTVILYNPVGRPVNYWVRIPVTQANYNVYAPNKEQIKTQMNPVSAETKNIPAHNGSKATGELVFLAELPALGFKTFFVEAASGDPGKTVDPAPAAPKEVSIKNEHLKLTFDSNTGLLTTMENLDSNIKQSVSQKLAYYESADGNNSKPEFQASGAYIFRPKEGTTKPTDIGGKATITVVQGTLVQEVHQKFSDWASQVVRLYDGEKYAEIEWTVGPIPYEDKVGKEVISYFQTDLKTDSTFYTDANGREILKRVRDYRPTWTLNQTEHIAGNYYPVNSRIYIQEESTSSSSPAQLTVLTDRSQGGASIQNGSIELMVHRRMFVDDSFGVGEALNETGISGKGLVVRGKHYVLLETVADSARLHRDMSQRVFMAPTVTFANYTDTDSYNKTYKLMWSALKKPLPANVHLLTLEQWKAATFLLRLEHFYEKNEDSTLSKPATVSLKGLFEPFEIDQVVELTLGANQPLSEAKRLSWNVKDFGQTREHMSDYVTPITGSAIDITLTPMQIRTFEVHIVEK